MLQEELDREYVVSLNCVRTFLARVLGHKISSFVVVFFYLDSCVFENVTGPSNTTFY